MNKLTSVTLAALLVGTTVAHAQAPAPAPAPTPAPAPAPVPGPTAQPAPPPQTPQTPDEKKAAAKALYEQGLSAYNLGKFDEAIKAFSDAYALSQAPGLLFNIAQSHRLAKDYERATYFYTTYLRLKPDAANRADVEARLQEMKDLMEEQKKLDKKPPEGVVDPNNVQTTTGPVVPTGPTEPVDKGDPEAAKKAQKLMTIGLVTGAAGGALVITGLVFGMMASGAESDLNALSDDRGTWTAAQQDTYDSGKRNNTIAIVSFVLGGAAVATGGTLYVLGMMKKKDATVAINPTPGGTTVAFGWSF